jgi:hypothetical protein
MVARQCDSWLLVLGMAYTGGALCKMYSMQLSVMAAAVR